MLRVAKNNIHWTIYSATDTGQRIGSKEICAIIFSDREKQDFYNIVMYLIFYHTAWVVKKSYIELKKSQSC